MKLKYEMEFIDVDEEMMAVPVSGDDSFRGLINMNETGKDILKILENEVSEEEIVLEMKNIYDASDEEIRHSVKKVLGILREYELLA